MILILVLAGEGIRQITIILDNFKTLFNLSKRKYVETKDTNILDYNEDIELYLQGLDKELNTESFDNINTPEWLDVNKLRRGQEFAKSYYVSICYSELISLYLLFTHDRSLRSLIFTRKSDSVESAFKRYMSTIHRVKCWYEDDLLNAASPARKHIQVVNNFHLRISTKLNSISEEQFINQSNLDSENMESDKCHERMTTFFEKDDEINDNRLLQELESCKHITQTHMAMTQFGFMGLIVLYPEKFGINKTEELDCFIHLWKYLGSQLGIEDKYNLCAGSLYQVRKRCEALLELIAKPCMRQVNSSWEHMSLCVFKGVNRVTKILIFETTLAWLLKCVDLENDSFYNSMKLKSKLLYYLMTLVFQYLVPIKWVRVKLNHTLDKILEKEKIFS